MYLVVENKKTLFLHIGNLTHCCFYCYTIIKRISIIKLKIK